LAKGWFGKRTYRTESEDVTTAGTSPNDAGGRDTPELYLVSKAEIDASDPSLVKSAVMGLLGRWMATDEFAPIHLGVSGFDDDPRALYEISEVRKWAKALLADCNFTLAVVDGRTMKWLVPCLADIEIVGRESGRTAWRIVPETEEQFLGEVIHAREVVYRRLAKSDQEYDRLCSEHTDRYNAIFPP
jgi:hypothetical protein